MTNVFLKDTFEQLEKAHFQSLIITNASGYLSTILCIISYDRSRITSVQLSYQWSLGILSIDLELGWSFKVRTPDENKSRDF